MKKPKPDTNSETKAESIPARASLWIETDYSDSFEEMLDTPFHHWEDASFTQPYCNYCGLRNCAC